MYNKKKVIIIVMMIAVVLMVVVYAALSTKLIINGTGKITSTWHVFFESIETEELRGEGSNNGDPIITDTSIKFNVNLRKPGDGITYSAVLKNGGSIDAIINNIDASMSGASVVQYSVTGIKKGEKLPAGASKTITITVDFDRNATSIPAVTSNELIVNIECIQDDGQAIPEEDITIQKIMLKPGDTASSFLSGPIAKSSIESINFTNTNVVASNAIDSWDVSSDGKGGVMAWYTDSDNDNLYEVTIGQKGGVVANSNSSNLFNGLSQLTSINFSQFDTSEVTNMSGTFRHCSSLTSLDVSSFNTNKVTDMSWMFSGCSKLTSLDLSNFNTSNVTTMMSMFYGTIKMNDLNISSFNTSKVTDMSGMFYSAQGIENLNLNHFDTSNVTTMERMFSEMASLVRLDISSFETPRLTNMNYFCNYNTKLKYIDMRKMNMVSIGSPTEAFAGLDSIEEIIVRSTDEQYIINKSHASYPVIVA